VQPNVAPEKALPVHLDEATQSDGWMDVTPSYRTLFQPPESSEFDRLLDQFLPAPDGRLAYIKMVTGHLKTVAATRTLTTSVNEYVQLMDSLKENLATMSDEERARLMKSIGFEARSIRHIYGDVVDLLFSVDEALSLDEARSKSTSDPNHYSQLSDQPMVEIDWHGHLESSILFLRRRAIRCTGH